MRVSKVFPVNLPIDRIDMYRWVTEMTTEDYESFTPAHKAMGSFFHGSRFFMVNVEYIGSDMLVQHYELIDHSKSHVKFYSRRTRGYVYRWFPVTFSVPWEMALRRSRIPLGAPRCNRPGERNRVLYPPPPCCGRRCLCQGHRAEVRFAHRQTDDR
jgi:hypothetical protein